MRSATALAALLAACAPTTRSLDSGDTSGGPRLYGVEREVREGVITLPDKGETKLTKRVAVVIGNSAYAHVPTLSNPRNDANAMAELLRSQGFQVVQGVDIGKRSFERLLRNAVRAGGPGAEIVAFYAGHGFQIGSNNYLVPVDASLSGANDLPFQTVRLDTMLKVLGDRSDRHISFLDSCRNNPFPGAEEKTGVSRGTGTTEVGFAEPRVPSGGFVAYSTMPGAVAYDGDGTPNSPFTSALLKSIRSAPTAPIDQTLKSVRSDVRSATGGKQTPTWTSRLNGRFSFKEGSDRPADISPEVAEAGTKPAAATPAAARPPAPTRPPVSPASAPAPSAKPSVTVEAPMEKVVAAGGRIAEKLDLPPDATISVVTPPSKGNVAKITAAATLAEASSQPVAVADAGAVVYVAPPEQKPVTGSAGAAMTDSLVVEVRRPNAAPERVNVTLQLTPNGCDVEAGDFLDLQGVGVYRPEKSMAPTRAIEACDKAVREDPTNGRFQFQLGKALEAAGRTQAAIDAYKKAAAMGHIRADNALGNIALRVPATEPVGETYLRRCSDAGDPICAESLGIFLLKRARSEGEREEAYEILSYAMDFGLPKAMRALADHFDNPATPDHDPERAAVFGREAAAREAEIETTRPAPSAPRPPFGTPGRPDFMGPGGDDGGSDNSRSAPEPSGPTSPSGGPAGGPASPAGGPSGAPSGASF